MLAKVFERCRRYNLKMNPKKCTFGISAGKFLGFVVHQRGINVDTSKTQMIAASPPPSSPKELKSLLGKLSYFRRFIPGLAACSKICTPLLKKRAKF
ncbi:hypothetical protein TIFTF001_023297 [Ficus carica]|uniref:Uncharacterized protein n=1 Tax=Ficus carica TaxID=3494 RepID=A0AA88AEF9_FICCA|nr:hypothetical protein TIFTF001_023297 [Ficus carica]